MSKPTQIDDAHASAIRGRELLREVWLAIEKAGPHYRDSDLTSQQHVVLNLIIESPDISATALAAALGVTKGAISHHLAVLEERRYVKRRRSREDGRKQLLELDELGRIYRDKQEDFEKLAVERFALNMSPEELDEAVMLLSKLKAVLAPDQ